MDIGSLKSFLDERADEYEYTVDADASELTSFRCGGKIKIAVSPKSTPTPLVNPAYTGTPIAPTRI